jgi:predicted DNA-binding transcriptional regulator AlpA
VGILFQLEEKMASAPKFAKAVSSSAPAARLLSPDDVAQITGLSTETLAQWRSQRRGIPFVKISRNVVRYRQSDLDSFLDARIVAVESSQTRRP